MAMFLGRFPHRRYRLAGAFWKRGEGIGIVVLVYLGPEAVLRRWVGI
jgi:hypothetical protein